LHGNKRVHGRIACKYFVNNYLTIKNETTISCNIQFLCEFSLRKLQNSDFPYPLKWRHL